jgi:ketosteroid isomerase-like protein
MPAGKQIVERYLNGFARNDLEAILGCVAEDFVWVLHGVGTFEGKAMFAATLGQDLSRGDTTVGIDRLVEEGETVVALTRGSFVASGGGQATRFVTSEVFTVRGDAIGRLETYQVLLGG